MSLRSAIIQVLVMTLVTSPVMAQQQRSDSQEGWRAFAQQELSSGTLVKVRLKGGEIVKGKVVQVTAVALSVNPETRLAVPVRVMAFDTIQSIEREKEGMSRNAKMAMWGAIIGGSVIVTILIVRAMLGSN